MAIYYTACALSMVLAWFFTHTKFHSETGRIRFAVLFSAFPLFLVAAIRYGVGTDFFNYERIYRLAEGGIYYKSDFAFNFLITILIKIGLDSQWMYVVLAAIFCIFTYIAVFKDSPYPALSIFLLVGMTHYFLFLNIMRQMVGGAILLYSIRFIRDRRLIPYLICFGFAFGFHPICILFLPFYWAYLLEITPKQTLFLSLVVILSGNLLESIFVNVISRTEYAWYLDSIYSNTEVGYIYILVQLAILSLAIWQYKKDEKYKIYFIIQIVNVWLSLFSGRIALIERLRGLMGFPAIILIPLALSNIKNKNFRWLIYVAILIAFTVYSFLVCSSGNNGVLPYKSIVN